MGLTLRLTGLAGSSSGDSGGSGGSGSVAAPAPLPRTGARPAPAGAAFLGALGSAAAAAHGAPAPLLPRASPPPQPPLLPRGALNLSGLRGGPAMGWEPPVFGLNIFKEEFSVAASDGWTLHIVHTVDKGAPKATARSHPVLLCPGLASSGVGTFDLMPQV
jgi:hypothetical protein